MFLEARIRKRFPEFLLDARISCGKGETLGIIGPSGSGKTTMLSIIAGLVDADEAEINIGGKSVEGDPPEKREIGFVFQEKLLFPHLSVFENVAFGPRMRGTFQEAKVKRALEGVHLSALAQRNVSSLSGGEAQRVAIARAVAFEPKILLMDEPLKELDALVREKIKGDLRKLQEELGVTMLYVTHDLEEALFFADKIILLNKGRVEQEGNPMEVFKKPATEFVREFLSPYALKKVGGKPAVLRKSSFT